MFSFLPLAIITAIPSSATLRAVEAVKGVKATSILPVGVTRVVGDFEKDDLVRVMDEQGRQIGVGRVSADSAEALSMVGQHGQKPLVHYDYLYLE